jgi:hypothetical protein
MGTPMTSALTLVFAFATSPRLAAAQPLTPSAPATAAGAEAWERGYQEARHELVMGRFATCARLFANLMDSSPDDIRRARAAEAASLCRTWADGGFDLVLRSQLPGGGGEDRRTLDELAVLYTTSVLYGIGSGVALATWTEPSSPAGAILPALGFAGAAAGAVALLDHFGRFRYGVPQSAASGLLIGLEEGMAWTMWNQGRVTFAEEWETSTIAGLWWAGATAGALAGGVLGSVYGTTPGRASLMGSGALWGGLIAGLSSAALTSRDGTQDDNGWLAAALALNVGALGGAYLGAEVSPSIARVRFIDLGGLAGALTLGGLYWALGGRDTEERAVMTAVATGSAAGLATAWYFTRNMAPDHPRNGPRDAALRSMVPMVAPAPGGALGGVAGAF